MDEAILNLTQHVATPEQIAAGVVEPEPGVKAQIQRLLTFNVPPETEEMVDRAIELARIADRHGVNAAMIGGAPYFMPVLQWALALFGITPLYAFSVRESVEERQPDGSVRKTSVFRHVAFVRAPSPEECARVWVFKGVKD